MTNAQVIMEFINGGVAKTKNLRVEGKFLYNYDTPLAMRLNVNSGEEKIMYVINATKYSQSTTTIQNQLLKFIPENDILRVVTGIPMGANYLI